MLLTAKEHIIVYVRVLTIATQAHIVPLRSPKLPHAFQSVLQYLGMDQRVPVKATKQDPVQNLS